MGAESAKHKKRQHGSTIGENGTGWVRSAARRVRVAIVRAWLGAVRGLLVVLMIQQPWAVVAAAPRPFVVMFGPPPMGERSGTGPQGGPGRSLVGAGIGIKGI